MSTSSPENQDYIQGILTNNHQVVRTIYEKYHKAIIQLVETNRGTKEDAKDVFQEALLLIYQKAKQPDFQLTSSFFTYFYAICRNIWSNKTRKKAFGEVTLSDEKASMLIEDDTEQYHKNEQYILYRRKFLELGESCQQVLTLFLKKVSLKEIAVQLGLSSEGYAKKKKYQCKKQLVKLIQMDTSYQELKAGV